jgi:hypothetical protein
MKAIILFTSILYIDLLMSCPVMAEDFVFRGKPSEYEDYGYLVRGAAWRFEPGQRAIVFVCWENPTVTNEEARIWVEDQVKNTWQRHTKLEFRGWQKCAAENNGIRVLFRDEGPHVKAFGRYINGVKEGLVLNDTFRLWSTQCQDEREFCIRSIAAHEFGHALGFAHEQNRPDTPGECSGQFAQGQTTEAILTPYDPSSVMNYCNSKYNNNGTLSALDIKGAQKVYGPPRN